MMTKSCCVAFLELLSPGNSPNITAHTEVSCNGLGHRQSGENAMTSLNGIN